MAIASSLEPSAAPGEGIGTEAATIKVELSTRFLEHFSEQLYSSPQKAFEELITNGWDAGANCVDVRIPQNLSAPSACLTVFDNGVSMDEKGLRDLWHIAFSPKKDKPSQFGRAVVGKFGIGKLSTYVLAYKLTYICKAADGKVRRVMMDYGDVDQKSDKTKLISDIELTVYEMSAPDLKSTLEALENGEAIAKLIEKGATAPEVIDDEEYNTAASKLQKPKQDTWTLVILSQLKPTGRDLKVGVLRKMLEAALPLGTEMAIYLNEEPLRSSKIDAEIMGEWDIGAALGIDSVEIDDKSKPVVPGSTELPQRTIAVASGKSRRPFVDIPGIGRITGRVRLYRDKITGQKSDMRGASNGFHVNVLGRVVNQADTSFGEINLSHAAWARFRMTVRADGLNQFITTDREKFRESDELVAFRAFLRRAFNFARSVYDGDKSVEMPDGGDVLVKSLGVLSLNPLRNVVSDTLQSGAPLSDLFDEDGVKDRAAKRQDWQLRTQENIGAAVETVKYETVQDDSFVKFRLHDNAIIVNKQHPFVAEHSGSKAEKELVRTIALVNFLTDMYSLDIGVEPPVLHNIRAYRDRLMRFQAMRRRSSGTFIAQVLLQMQHDSSNSRRLEAIVGDALEYIGFDVERLGKPGEPEGVAKAFTLPSGKRPDQDAPNPPLYSFTFDAKSTKGDTAAVNNLNLAGITEHRKRYKADYALVVAPGYSDGATAVRCAQQGVTPITARDLGRLLECTADHGAIPLPKLKELFAIHDPAKVSAWVDDLPAWIGKQRPLTIDNFLKALARLKGDIPDALAASSISLECRRALKLPSVTDEDVLAIAKGLQILIPDLIAVDNDKVVVNASSERIAETVAKQLEGMRKPLPSDMSSEEV